MRAHGLLRRLADDTDGATLVEFAFVAPVLIVLLMGTFDIGHQMYATSVLHGTLQQAARTATIEGGVANSARVDQFIEEQIGRVMSTGTVTITRRNFQNFADLVTPEKFTDTNGDKICNNGEAFEDLNANGTHDKDRGRDGNGGARDAVRFTATVDYERMFPLAGFIPAISKDVRIRAETVLRNQPFDKQLQRVPVAGTCP